MRENNSMLNRALQFIKEKKYNKALSCYNLFSFLNENISNIISINKKIIEKNSIQYQEMSEFIAMEIPVFNNKNYLIKKFKEILVTSPFDVKIDIIKGTAEKSFLIAWFDSAEIIGTTQSEKENLSNALQIFLKKTAFFDRDFYTAQYRPTLDNGDELDHFLSQGFADGNLPAKWFDLHVQKNKRLDSIIENKYQDSTYPTSPKISVIVPVYNNTQYLKECIESIMSQTLADIEIILINDGSTDQNAIDILDYYAKKDARIRLIHKKNTGYGHTMNCGLLSAQGEYIGIVESDDYILKEMYKTLYTKAIELNANIIRSDPSEFTGSGNSRRFRVIKSSISGKLYNKNINIYNSKDYFRMVSLNPTGIYRKKFLEENNINFNETPGASFQDIGFFFKVSICTDSIYIINSSFYMVRRDNENSSVFSSGKVYCAPNEFKNIYNFIAKNSDRFSKFLPHFTLKKYLSYRFHLSRLRGKELSIFKDIFREEFLQAIEKKELNASFFTKEELAQITAICEVSTPKVSIIIPIFNASKYIEKCVRSVQKQSLKQIEILCINDGSTDNTIDILQGLQKEDSRINIINQENSGASAARNNGIKRAQGEFLAFLDADDFYPDADSLSILYANAKKFKTNISGGRLLYHEREQIVEKKVPQLSFEDGKVIKYSDFQFDYGYQCFLFSRSLIEKNQLIFPLYKRFQDPPFFVRAMYYSETFCTSKVPAYCYRIGHQNGLSHTKFLDILKGLQSNLDFADKNNLDILYKLCLSRLIDFSKRMYSTKK